MELTPNSIKSWWICCDAMRRHGRSTAEVGCSIHADPLECPDVLVVYFHKFDEYGLPVRDAGGSLVTIAHCPWCGRVFGPSRRDAWFEALDALGFEEPFDAVRDGLAPPEFSSDAWWRRPDSE